MRHKRARSARQAATPRGGRALSWVLVLALLTALGCKPRFAPPPPGQGGQPMTSPDGPQRGFTHGPPPGVEAATNPEFEAALLDHILVMEQLGTLVKRVQAESNSVPVFPAEVESLAEKVLATQHKLRAYGPATPGFDATVDKHRNRLRDARNQMIFWIHTGGVANPRESARMNALKARLGSAF